MAINKTSTLKLRQITYLHDGEESADAYNETMTILDALFTYFVSHRYIDSNEGAMAYFPNESDVIELVFQTTNTPITVPTVIDRATGQPIISRISLPY